MPLETASFISQLNPSYPLLSDTVYSLQGHTILLKQVLQSQFPNLGAAAVTGTAAALNAASGAFGASSVTVPQAGSGGASVVLPAGSSGTAMTVAACVPPGLAVVAQPPTAGGVTPPQVVEIRTDGAGNVKCLTSLIAPTVSASASIKKAGFELLPSGVIMLWSGSIASIPGGYALCNGLNGTPNLVDKFVVGAGNLYGVGAQGGSVSATLSTANLPAHSHPLSDPSHSHAIYDPGHAHNVSDPGHNHGIYDPGHSHTYQANSTNSNGSGSSLNYSGAGMAAATAAASTGISAIGAYTGISIQTHFVNITNQAATTGITMGNTGSGTAFGILPPYYALAFIMKL